MNFFIFIFVTSFIVSHLFILAKALQRFVTIFADQYIKVKINCHSNTAPLIESYSQTVRRLPCSHSEGHRLPHCTCLIIDNLHRVSLGRLFLKTFEKEVYLTGIIINQELLCIRELIQGPPLPDPTEAEIDSLELCLYILRQIAAQSLSLAQMVLSIILGEIYQIAFSYLTPKTLPSAAVSYHCKLPPTILSSVKHRRHSTSL